MTTIDWWIIAAFVITLGAITISTNRITKSVAGFLSAERLAGRYLLTIAQSMAFIAAIGVIGQFEGYYRNGIGGVWWGLLLTAASIIIALSGWVAYRYRQTRALTMAQFLEMRYSRNFRVFSGIICFFSGVLNCAVFPMVTANFLIYFLGLPLHVEWLGIQLPTYHLLMLLMIGTAVLLAISGGLNTIMVTSFFQGIIASAACIGCVWFIIYHFGWNNIINTLGQAEHIKNIANTGPEWFQEIVQSSLAEPGKYPDIIDGLSRLEGASMLNPMKQEGMPDFGPSYFIMMTFLFVAKTGVWQGGAGFMTAAKTPHEAKMGNILGSWRWLMVTLGMVGMAAGGYVLIWNPAYQEAQAQISHTLHGITSPHLQSQMIIPIAIRYLLPPGLLGLFAIFMIGSAVSTDDSAYHSWGSVFLQDIIMPFRKTPIPTKKHLTYLRWSIVMIGAISFVFSSIWTMKDFINMWFEITGAIYIGGASCAIIGGLYWKRGTTAGAWCGLISGSLISVCSILIKQRWPSLTFPGTDIVINGIHMAVFAVLFSYAMYILVSWITCKHPYNMDRLLHRGDFQTGNNCVETNPQPCTTRWSKLLHLIGITNEFSQTDKCIYIVMILWTVGWSVTFIIGTIYNLMIRQLTSDEWKFWWTVIFIIQGTVALLSAIWFSIGGIFDVTYLFKKLMHNKIDEQDDGTVHKTTNQQD